MDAYGSSSGCSTQHTPEGRVIEFHGPTRAGDLAVPVAESALVPTRPPAQDRHPAMVYLASPSEDSWRKMRAPQETIARLVSAERADAWNLPWHERRYQHTSAIRSELDESYAPATANKMLSAMKGVIKGCWRLGYITARRGSGAARRSVSRRNTRLHVRGGLGR